MADLDISGDGSPRPYLGQVSRSRSQVKVHGQGWKNSQVENIFGYAGTLPVETKEDPNLEL